MMFDEKSGWYLPDGERHLPEWMIKVNQRVHGRLAYQYRKYQAAMKHVKRREFAVDIGAHVGLWSWHMARDFRQVWSFEPMPEHRSCFQKNMNGANNVHLYQCALGADSGIAHIRTRTPGSSGDTGIDNEGERVEMRRLDDFDVPDLDFLKIDCEGYELFVLRGAEQTLRRFKPVVIVEQKPKTGMTARYGVGERDACHFLASLGANQVFEISGDYCFVWKS